MQNPSRRSSSWCLIEGNCLSFTSQQSNFSPCPLTTPCTTVARPVSATFRLIQHGREKCQTIMSKVKFVWLSCCNFFYHVSVNEYKKWLDQDYYAWWNSTICLLCVWKIGSKWQTINKSAQMQIQAADLRAEEVLTNGGHLNMLILYFLTEIY